MPVDIVLELYSKAGGVPRYILERVGEAMKYYDLKTLEGRDEILRVSFEHIADAISETENFADLLKCFTGKSENIHISNCLIHRWPNLTYDNYYLGWASNFIFDKIQKRLEIHAWNDLLGKIQDHKKYPSARGIMFELHVIHLFMSGNHHFETRKLEKCKVSLM